MAKEIEISMVIPVCNEQENVETLYRKLKAVLDRLNKGYEIIFVDDGSTDDTFRKIKQLHKNDDKVKGIQFQKNFKKSAAYMAGFKECRGSIVITIDGDLQDDPEEIPKFLEALKEYDLVVGWKYPRKDPITRKIASSVFNKLNNLLFGISLHDSDCGYRAMKAHISKGLNLYGDLYRYIPAMVSRRGYKVGEIKVRHQERKFGKSKYSAKRLATGMLDIITVKFLSDFNQRPLHLFGGIGLIFAALGFLAELYVLYFRIILNELFSRHLAMLIFGVLMILVGVQLFGIGLIGELMIASSRNVERYTIKEYLK